MAAGKILQIKRGTAASLVTLAVGEFGFTTDTKLLYMGNGASNDLIGGIGILRDVAAGITLANADLTLKGLPTTDNMAATKAYVDAARMGLDVKGSVRAATVVTGTLATAFANGQVIDTVTLATGDRILIKNQTAGADNGIYTVNASGAPTRAVDMPAGAGFGPGAYMFVEEGSQADTGWIMTNNGAINIGSTAQVYAQFTGGAAYTASLGVEKSGSNMQLDILADAGLALTGNEVGIKLDGTTLAMGASGLKLKAATAQYKHLVSGGTPFDYAEAPISDMAGAGMTATNGVLNVIAGSLVTVAADSVGITPAAADYSFIKALQTPWTPIWATLASLVGAGLVHTAGVFSTVANDMDFGAFV